MLALEEALVCAIPGWNRTAEAKVKATFMFDDADDDGGDDVRDDAVLILCDEAHCSDACFDRVSSAIFSPCSHIFIVLAYS